MGLLCVVVVVIFAAAVAANAVVAGCYLPGRTSNWAPCTFVEKIARYDNDGNDASWLHVFLCWVLC